MLTRCRGRHRRRRYAINHVVIEVRTWRVRPGNREKIMPSLEPNIYAASVNKEEAIGGVGVELRNARQANRWHGS